MAEGWVIVGALADPDGWDVPVGWVIVGALADPEGCGAGVTPVWVEAAAPGAVFVTNVVHLAAVAAAVVVWRCVARALKAVDVSALEVAPAPVR